MDYGPQRGHVIGNPSDYAAMEYAPQQMMYSVGPGQQVVGGPLVPNIGLGGVIQGGQPMMGGLGIGSMNMLGSGNVPSQVVARGRGPGDGSGGVDMLEELLGPFPVVRLRGLPFEAQVSDIISFFQGIGVLDVIVLQRGEAIVVFNTVMDSHMALQRDRQNMGRRYIEVFHAQRSDYYNAIAQSWGGGEQQQGGGVDRSSSSSSVSRTQQQHGSNSGGGAGTGGNGSGASSHQGNGGAGTGRESSSSGNNSSSGSNERAQNSGVLKLRGLPFSSNKQNIQEFFEGYTLRPDGVHFVYRSDGRLTGEAFAVFSTPEDARAAHRAKDRSMIGSRYVEIFPSTTEECGRMTGQKV